MNKELQEWCDSLIKGACFHCEDVALRNIELKKENARLREALKKIASEEYGRPTDMMLIARKALEETT